MARGRDIARASAERALGMDAEPDLDRTREGILAAALQTVPVAEAGAAGGAVADR